MGRSWADGALDKLGYNNNPERLQSIIRSAFQIATSQITIRGVNQQDIIPVPLFEILDANDRLDYVQRVEPALQGGEKMANAFLNALADPDAARNQGVDFPGWKVEL